MLCFAAAPLIALVAPRFMTAWPALAGLAAFIGFAVVYRRMVPVPREPLLWVCGILGLGALSALWALDGGHAFSRALRTAPIILFPLGLIGAGYALPRALLARYAGWVVWAGVFAAGACCAELLLRMPLYRLLHGISNPNHVDPSDINRVVIVLFALFFCLLGMARARGDRAAVFCLFAAYAGLTVLTSSQSAQLGLILGLVCLFAFPYGRRWGWFAATWGAVAAICLAPFLAIWMFGAFAAPVAEMPWAGQGGAFGAIRLEVWDKVARYALKSPLLGFGMDATRTITDFDSAQIYRKGVTELHPHNFAIELWIEFGVIGAALGSVLFFRLFRVMRRLPYKQARVALPSLMAVLSPAAFGYGLWQGWFAGLIIFIVAFCVVAMRLYEEGDAAAAAPLSQGGSDE